MSVFRSLLFLGILLSNYTFAHTIDPRFFTLSPESIEITRIGNRAQTLTETLESTLPLLTLAAGRSSKNAPAATVDNPSISSPESIISDFNELKAQWNYALASALSSDELATAAYVQNIGDPTKLYTDLRNILRVHQQNNRWRSIEERYDFLRANATRDVRPYLKLFPFVAKKIDWNLFNSFEPELRQKLEPWLVALCYHANFSDQTCREMWEQSKSNNTVSAYFNQFWYLAEYWWKFYFSIQRSRVNPKIQINQNLKTIFVPYLQSNNAELNRLLVKEIEEEYQLNGWRVKLQATTDESEAAFSVRFEENSEPYALGNHTIVLNPKEGFERPLTRWTLRHEFGHIFGFMDCYVEFVNPQNPSEVIYFEIEKKNIMCSRFGKFNKKMLDTILETYHESNE